MPEIMIRTATSFDASQIVQVHIKCWQEAYRGIIDQAYLDNLPTTFDKRLQIRQETLAQKNISIHLVAEYEGEIIGFCDAGIARNCTQAKGEIYTIYLLQNCHNLGIGKQLWDRTVEFLSANDLIPFTVLVLKDNLPARKFYEKLGSIEIAKESTEIAGKTYEEVRYIVSNLSENR